MPTTKPQATKHAQNCFRAFSHYDASCPRCRELIAGQAPRKGWQAIQKNNLAQLVKTIHAHDCKKSGCAPICTFGDW